MGGKAIKIAERVSKDVFFKYSKEIIPRVEKSFDTKVKMVNSFKDKEDFGDLDLLVLADRDFGDRKEIIKNEFSPKEISVNSHIISFNYNELQVDLIFTPTHNWEPSKIFFEWGDLGNLMGKIINNYGKLNNHGYLLKYGYDGLKAKILHKGKSKMISITKDNKKVFDFLGLDFNGWKKGFDNATDMFNYVIKSTYFDYNSFQWENLNSINRHRNKRRVGYNDFLKFIENHKNSYLWSEDYKFYLKEIKNFFGVNLYKIKKDFIKEVNTTESISKKFNGTIVMKHFPNLKGIELGSSLTEFKKSIENFDNFILKNSQEEIIKRFKQFLNKSK